jgi:hypothetical protein
MRFSTPLVAAFGVTVSALTIKDANKNVVPGAYIVQFEAGSVSQTASNAIDYRFISI